MGNVNLNFITEPEVRSILKDELTKFFPEEVINFWRTQAAPVPSDQKFDISGLAEYLNCSVQTIHNLKKEGALPYYRLGRKVYFKKSEVDTIARVKSLKKSRPYNDLINIAKGNA